MSGRRSSSRSQGLVAVCAAIVIALSACAPTPSPDPALVSLTADALSATRSAQLGTGLRDDGRMFSTTTHALLGDMEQKIADVAREAGLHAPADATDAAYRDELLKATDDALDAMHAASAGKDDGEARLDAAADRLEDLEKQGGGS
ncbi:hypothetical protein G5T42_03470 [Microbacterium sp. 4R-513]|uniref:hypothetical protein n=1 Tax=Microbacterium sp. 4R-513 TaxID=2567934 RepID=UPI0013E1DE11|nr:hypothetical protein [Microbacterium sp. 4R-513]QIG38659.1 hypothetical protein G5T42_03470 [Microbacterium sp. 4R-513]